MPDERNVSCQINRPLTDLAFTLLKRLSATPISSSREILNEKSISTRKINRNLLLKIKYLLTPIDLWIFWNIYIYVSKDLAEGKFG